MSRRIECSQSRRARAQRGQAKFRRSQNRALMRGGRA